MKILWFTWKDRKNPHAGGAEIVNEEIARRLSRDGHEVVFVVAGFPGAKKEEVIDGYKIIRLGGKYTVYWKAYRFYVRYLQGWADLVIDEMNTLPFFCKFYVKERVIFFPHQLCREIWFYEMVFPFNIIGYCIEPFYLWLIRDYETITVSKSSKQDLVKYGFHADKVHILSEGIEINPIADVESVEKYAKPTVLSLGTIRSMKRTIHQIRAFEIAKREIPDLQMKIAGDAPGSYGKKVLKMIQKSPYGSDIEYFGKVDKAKKIELMQKSHAILVTSVKEGWGLIVTEANSQGTVAVGYDVDGLRDSIRNNETGLLTTCNTPQYLAIAIAHLFQDMKRYVILRKVAWQWSFEFSFEKSYSRFLDIIVKK